MRVYILSLALGCAMIALPVSAQSYWEASDDVGTGSDSPASAVAPDGTASPVDAGATGGDAAPDPVSSIDAADASTLVDGDAAPDASSDFATADGDATVQAEAVRLAASDPEMSAILSAEPAVGVLTAGTWDETATRDYYSRQLYLAWRHPLGDYFPTLIGSATVPDKDARFQVKIPVSGKDFYLRSDGTGSAVYDSRNAAAAYRPTLIVNGTTKYTATRDVILSASTAASQKATTELSDRDAMLIAFDSYKPKIGDKAVLVLTTERQYGTHALQVYQPDIHYEFPNIDTSDSPPPEIVRDVKASEYYRAPRITITDNVVTGYWGGLTNTAISQVFKLPPAREYYMTVVMRVHSDWPDQGGKFPGLSNTGQAYNSINHPLIINGVNCSNSGWGGRPATGCRWSARTGWAGRNGGRMGLHTYYYSQYPGGQYGYIQNWPTPAPVNKWFAYVERVRVNDPGQGNGKLSYWLCTPDGCAAQFDRSDITWSNGDIPESLITEAWADVFCGGTGCPGPNPWPVATADLGRMTVTTGMPDLAQIFAEVNGLNSGN